MVVMYHFVFWFSTRFGSVVVSVFTLLQSMVCLIATIIGIRNKDAVQEELHFWLRNYDMQFMKDTLDDIKGDLETYLIGFITYLTLHCFSCFLLLYGALKVSVWTVYPFLVLEIARLIFLTVSFIVTMLLIKKNAFDLGLLIGSCCGGGFVLLFLLYLWFCVLSFIQMVKELQQEMCHHEDAKLNLQTYQQMNVAEDYSKNEDFAPISDSGRRYNKKFVNESFLTRFKTGDCYSNVMARPEY